jgi:hypothetical protein
MNNGNRVFRRRIVLVLLLLAVGGISAYFLVGGAVYYWKENVHHYQAGAISSLFALHTMEENYKKDHGTYPGSFEEPGVPLAARLDGDSLIWNGPYRFRVMDVRSQTGLVQHYRIEARPDQYSYQSRRSFLMDSTGHVHFTPQNREATFSDPALAPED